MMMTLSIGKIGLMTVFFVLFTASNTTNFGVAKGATATANVQGSYNPIGNRATGGQRLFAAYVFEIERS